MLPKPITNNDKIKTLTGSEVVPVDKVIGAKNLLLIMIKEDKRLEWHAGKIEAKIEKAFRLR